MSLIHEKKKKVWLSAKDKAIADVIRAKLSLGRKKMSKEEEKKALVYFKKVDLAWIRAGLKVGLDPKEDSTSVLYSKKYFVPGVSTSRKRKLKPM